MSLQFWSPRAQKLAWLLWTLGDILYPLSNTSPTPLHFSFYIFIYKVLIHDCMFFYADIFEPDDTVDMLQNSYLKLRCPEAEGWTE